MGTAKKDKLKLYGLSLIKDLQEADANRKRHLKRNSVLECNNLNALSEKIDAEGGSEIEMKYAEIFSSLDLRLSIPPRVPFAGIKPEDYRMVELAVFNKWKQIHASKVFERNIEIWRQFWILCERSDVLVQIVDARNVDFFFNHDILTVYPKKKHIVLCNKIDLLNEEEAKKIEDMFKRKNIECHLYSTTTGRSNIVLTGYVGLIGYPNVGKSSTINMLLNKKKARVSATPGKTKHIQTIKTDTLVIHDCPGLVFPMHSKIDLIINGVINIDHAFELMKYEVAILNKIGINTIKNVFGIPQNVEDPLAWISKEKSIPKADCLKLLLKSHISGQFAIKKNLNFKR